MIVETSNLTPNPFPRGKRNRIKKSRERVRVIALGQSGEAGRMP
jgi:hypothetical protein